MAASIATASTATFPNIANATVPASNVVLIVNYGPAVEKLTLQGIGAALKISTDDSLTDGGALGAAAFFTVAADVPFEIDMREGTLGGLRRGSLAIATASVSTVPLQLMAEGGEQK